MSNIWGIAAPNIDESLIRVFDKMTKVMPFSVKNVVNVKKQKNIIFGHCNSGTFHKAGFEDHEKNSDLFAVAGVPIWEGNGTDISDFNKSLNDTDYDSKLVQSKIKQNKLCDVGGVYSFAWWKASTLELLLGTDRLGFKSIYYLYEPIDNVMYFASRLCGLVDALSIGSDYNWAAISEFLKFGHPLGNKTFYSKINLVPPGTILKFSKKGIDFQRYFDVGQIQIDHNLSYQDSVELNAEAFKKSIKRRVSRCEKVNTLVLLSGGADSRRISGELHQQDVEFDTFTTRGFCAEDSEAPVAAQVAKVLGVKNTFIELPFDGFIKNYWSRANRLNDFECCLHQWLLPLAEHLPKNSCVNYDGIAGDMLLEGVFRSSGFADIASFDGVNSSDIYEKSKKIIGTRPKYNFFKDDLKRKLLSVELEDSVANSLSEYEGSENQLTLFFLMNRTRRAISLAPGRILQSKIESMYPFLDYDVLKASLSVPYKYRIAHTLRRDIVKFSFPHLSEIPYTQYKYQVPGYTKNLEKVYRREKLHQLRANIFKYFINNNRVFDPYIVGPSLLARFCLTYLGLSRVPDELCLTFQVFYEWLSEYDISVSDL